MRVFGIQGPVDRAVRVTPRPGDQGCTRILTARGYQHATRRNEMAVFTHLVFLVNEAHDPFLHHFFESNPASDEVIQGRETTFAEDFEQFRVIVRIHYATYVRGYSTLGLHAHSGLKTPRTDNIDFLL